MSSTQHTGIDHHSGRTYTAGVENDSGRLIIKSLTCRGIEGSVDSQPDFENPALAVPDNEVVVKRLRLNGNHQSDFHRRLSFELAQSSLEDEQLFQFDFYAIDEQNRYLGLVYRRELLARLKQSCGVEDQSVEYRLRSIALGKGYLAFCRQEEGDLLCLADLTSEGVSICLLLRQRLIEVAFLPCTGYDIAAAEEKDRLAIDLKTVVNFRLAALLDYGVSLPLSGLVLSGSGIDSGFCETLEKYFHVGVTSPRIHDGYLGSLADTVSIDDPIRFLVALGLAAG